MKLLILGASDSEGTLLANFADSWREQLRTRLPALIGEPVEIDHRRFYVHLPGSYDYFERYLDEAKPDFVIMPCTGFAFTTASVGNRLRNKLGTHVGTWLERRYIPIDRWSEDAPVGSTKGRLNVALHRIAGSAVGRDSTASYDAVLRGYTRCIDRLARDEEIDAVIMGTTYNGPMIQRRLPGLKAKADRFNRELRAAAEARRFAWVDRQALINDLPEDVARPDQMHTGPEVHARYAEALIPLVAARRLDRA